MPNPYLQQMYPNLFPQLQQPYAAPQSAFSAQRYEVIKVNGENGATALQMAPNSSALLLDETAPIVWLAQTDGAGYKTLTPYTITPARTKEQQSADLLGALEGRITRLEEIINGKSDTGRHESGQAGGSAG